MGHAILWYYGLILVMLLWAWSDPGSRFGWYPPRYETTAATLLVSSATVVSFFTDLLPLIGAFSIIGMILLIVLLLQTYQVWNNTPDKYARVIRWVCMDFPIATFVMIIAVFGVHGYLRLGFGLVGLTIVGACILYACRNSWHEHKLNSPSRFQHTSGV